MADPVRPLSTLGPSTKAAPEPASLFACHMLTQASMENRGLEFMCLALNANFNNKTEELATSFRNAYGTTLKPHHSFVVKPLFSAAMSACPARNDFYKKLGDDEAKVNELMQQYLGALDKIIGILKAFVNSKEAKW